MNKIIFGFVGKIGSGKTTFCKYLVENYQAEIFGFSKPLRDVLDRFYLPHSRENLQQVSQGLREALGQEVLAKVLAKDAENSQAKIVCVDGVRRPKDIEFLKKLKNFYLISVEADQKLRYERIMGRGQNPGEGKDELTFEQFQKNESAEAESLIEEVANEAKFIFNNDGSLDDLYKKVEEILAEIKE